MDKQQINNKYHYNREKTVSLFVVKWGIVALIWKLYVRKSLKFC